MKFYSRWPIHKVWGWAAFFIIILLVFFMLFNNSRDLKDHELIDIKLAEQTLTVEVVNSRASISKGLSERAEIGSDGMLFFLGERRQATFWMKDMKFNLDMLWIDGDRVVDISYNAQKPEPDTSDSDLEIYSPGVYVDKVLELKAGDAQKFGINLGDKIAL